MMAQLEKQTVLLEYFNLNHLDLLLPVATHVLTSLTSCINDENVQQLHFMVTCGSDW